MRHRHFITPICMFALSACAIGPDYISPKLTETTLSEIAQDDTLNITSGVALESTWWKRFDDPVLTELIERSARSNTDVRLAFYRVEEARADREIIRAAQRPILTGSSSATRQKSSETAGGFGPPPGAPSLQNLFNLNINLNWEIDLFGRLKRSAAAAEARLEASEDDKRAIMVSVFSEVGIAYAELRGLQSQNEVAGRNIEIASQTVNLTLLLFNQGLASEFDLLRARSDLTEAIARRNQFLTGQHAAAAQIALLTGQKPTDLTTTLLKEGPELIPRGRIPVGIPSDILRQRVDIRAAERQLAAASEQIGIAQADLLPRFSLTGSGGLNTANFEDLFDSDSRTWSVGGAANWPIFNGGSQRANIDIARSRFGAAGVEYEAAILGALAEVETALASYVYLAKELDGLAEAKIDRDRAYELALLRYRNNADSLFPTLDAGLRLTSLNSEIAQRRQALLVAEINVYRALGGGWQSFEGMTP